MVVVAGYTGTEVAAQGVLLTAELARGNPELAGQPMRWLAGSGPGDAAGAGSPALGDGRSGAARAGRAGIDPHVGGRGHHPWTGRSTPPFPAIGCSWAWSARRRSRWIPAHRADPDRSGAPRLGAQDVDLVDGWRAAVDAGGGSSEAALG